MRRLSRHSLRQHNDPAGNAIDLNLIMAICAAVSNECLAKQVCRTIIIFSGYASDSYATSNQKPDMHEIPKRLPPTLPVRQRLFALSRNICAYRGCTSALINENGKFVGQICHIEAALPGGERFNPNQSNEDRRSFENLMLMCYEHHIETNDEHKYKPSTLREMKAEHEKNTNHIKPNIDLMGKFLDQSLDQEFTLPINLNQLDIRGCEEGFFEHAPILLSKIARLPQKTRSLYAHAFIRAISGDLFLCFSPSQLEITLNQTECDLAPHLDILEREGLAVRWEADEGDWKNLPIRGPRYYLSGLDREDNGIFLLYLIHQRFRQSPYTILDLFENLNFQLLEI
ncbi:hypothetical protein [Burkholderia vietnamiensis]|jgi:hypothetical protein|uniref:hypothetical protein n=1 Tax=Burkholderia vietnamiensis TaxID=60552 RepID=UPI0012D8A8D2|nr:hypothetical protein [Burkholderia vietnamiensis]